MTIKNQQRIVMYSGEERGTQEFVDRLNQTFQKYAFLFKKIQFFLPITEEDRLLGFTPHAEFNHKNDEAVFTSIFNSIDSLKADVLDEKLKKFQDMLGVKPMSIDECKGIESIFRKEAFAGLLIKSSSLESEPYPSLSMQIGFTSQAQFDLFIKEIVPQLGCSYEIAHKGSQLQINLTIKSLKTGFSPTDLVKAFENCRLSVIDIRFYETMAEVFLTALENSRPGTAQDKYPQIVLKIDTNRAFYVSILRKKKPLEPGEVYCTPDDLTLVGEVLPMLAAQQHPTISAQKGRDGVFFEVKKSELYDAYNFYIKPEELDTILMRESDYYQGYRSGYSLFDLAHPEQEMMRQLEGDTICLFPVRDVSADDNSSLIDLLIRNSGCNVSEVISYQLSLLLKQYIPEKYGSLASYGHYSSPVTGVLGVGTEDLIEAALLSIGIPNEEIKDKVHTQSHEGLTTLALPRSSHHSLLKPMSNRAKLAFKDAATSKEELETLFSLEVPKQLFLQQLIDTLTREKTAGSHEGRLRRIETAIGDLQTAIERMNQEHTSTASAGLHTTGLFRTVPPAPPVVEEPDDGFEPTPL